MTVVKRKKMTAKVKIKKTHLPPYDFKTAGIITLSCTLAVLLNIVWHSPQAFWAVITATFLPLMKIGALPLPRTLSLIAFGAVSVLFIALGSFFHYHASFSLIFLFISALLIYGIPRYIPGSRVARIFMLVFLVLAQSMPLGSLADLPSRLLAACLGIAIAVLVNTIADRDRNLVVVEKADKSLALIQGAIRMGITLAFAVFLVESMNLYNAAWVAISVIVIDQTTLGASIKRASERLLGTVLGILVGGLLANYLFGPYPLSRFFCLLLVFVLFSVTKRNYTLAIFCATTLIANLFYLLISGHASLWGFLLARFCDTLLGIVIGIVSQLVIFPRTALDDIRFDLLSFWQQINLSLQLNNKENSALALTEAEKILDKLKQDIRHFRYEPIRLLLKRYHLVLRLFPLMHSLQLKLVGLEEIKSVLPVDIFKAQVLLPLESLAQLLVKFYQDPSVGYMEPLQAMERQLSESLLALKDQRTARLLIREARKIVRVYQTVTLTPRWRLELE